MRRSIICLLLPAIAGAALARSPVQFADMRLKAAVEEKLGIKDPTTEDMLKLTVFYFNYREDFSRLEGLQYASNLTTLQTVRNAIVDVRPLAGLDKLTKLDLWSNRISEIAPLGALEGLAELCLHHNRISDIQPLASLKNLTELRLNDNRIVDIRPLAPLTKLAYLDLRGNSIGNIAPLASLKSLQSLGLGGNQITDISALRELPKLSGWLHLDGSPIADHSVLSDLTGVASLSINNIGLTDASCIAPLTGLVQLDIGNNLIGDVSALANMTHLKYLNLQGNPLGLPVGGTDLWGNWSLEESDPYREYLLTAVRELVGVDFLGAYPSGKLPTNTVGFSDGSPKSGWIEQAGTLVLEAGAPSLFLVIGSCSGGQLDKYLTLLTPGKPGRMWLQLRWFPGDTVFGPSILRSQNSHNPAFAAEQRFLERIKYAYGRVSKADRLAGDLSDSAARSAAAAVGPEVEPADEQGIENLDRYGAALKLAQRQKARVAFVTAPRRMTFSFSGGLKYQSPGGWVQQIGTAELNGDGRRSLFIYSGGFGTRESEMYLTVLTPGKPGFTSLCMWFDGTDTDYGPDLHRSPNTKDPLYAPETAFLEAIKYAYDYISDEDILSRSDDPKFAAHLWGKDNGHLREGILTLRRYPGAPERCGSDRKVRLEVGRVIYSRCGSALMAYDADADEHYILYHARSTYFGPAVLKKVDSWLLIGLWGEGLVAVDLRDNYLKTLLAKRTSVGKIEVTDTEIILDDGAHVLDRSLLTRRAY